MLIRSQSHCPSNAEFLLLKYCFWRLAFWYASFFSRNDHDWRTFILSKQFFLFMMIFARTIVESILKIGVPRFDLLSCISMSFECMILLPNQKVLQLILCTISISLYKRSTVSRQLIDDWSQASSEVSWSPWPVIDSVQSFSFCQNLRYLIPLMQHPQSLPLPVQKGSSPRWGGYVPLIAC